MRVVFLGTGEAFDESFLNSSSIVIGKTVLLLDCGYSIPPQLWKYNPDPSFIDAIYLTHAHADHYFGLPAVLARMRADGRKKPLYIFCQKGLKKSILNLLEYGYPGGIKKNKYPVFFKEVDQGKKVIFHEFTMAFAYSIHSPKNLAIKIDGGKRIICYSGDGKYTPKTEALYRNADLVIHESFFLSKKTPGHTTIKEVIKMAEKNKVKCLALTHLEGNTRKNKKELIKRLIKRAKIKVIMPNPLDEVNLS